MSPRGLDLPLDDAPEQAEKSRDEVIQRSWPDGQHERETGAAAGRILGPDAAAVRFHDALCDGQTQARAAGSAAA